jgi:hypothetical protein
MARSDIYSLTIHPGLFPPDALVTGLGGSTWLGLSASRGMARIPAQKGRQFLAAVIVPYR